MKEIKVGDKVVMISGGFGNIEVVTDYDIGKWYMKYWRKATKREVEKGRRE